MSEVKMTQVVMDKKEEIVMKLTHFLITKENYTPIVVNGTKNEVWLENQEGPYKIIRINSNYIHNNEQYKFDLFKIRNIILAQHFFYFFAFFQRHI